MPTRHIPGLDTPYDLIIFDALGRERREPDGTMLSDTVQARLSNASQPYTDVFFTSHGWKGDVPAAIEQYDKWIGAMAAVKGDLDTAERLKPGFRPLIVGLHWPSLPWGDESIEPGASGLLSDEDMLSPAAFDAEVESYAAKIADSDAARAAIRTILASARGDGDSDAATLPPAVKSAYATLFDESGLDTNDPSGRPGAEQPRFDPEAILAEARAASNDDAMASGAMVLGGAGGFGSRVRDLLLSPLRQLSFWKMKDRARLFGETGGNALLRRLQQTAPQARFHLMGHSFGSIVVSATVAGAPGAPIGTRVRPVDSLYLVQGALSLWSYADDIPYARGTRGYFHRIVQDGLVRGPIVTTRSTRDTAVGRIYPLGAGVANQLTLAEDYPRFGGVGSFGLRGLGKVHDLDMRSSTYDYIFEPGGIYNLEASQIIRNGGGVSGAHSDIAHPEVAHVFWEAVLADRFGGMLGEPGGAMRGGVLPDDLDLAPMLERTFGGGLLGDDPAPAGAAEDDGFESLQPVPPATRAPPQAAPSLPEADPGAEAAPPTPPQQAQRWLHAEFEDHAPDEALAAGSWYTLAFDLDVRQRPSAAGTTALNDTGLFPEGVDEVQLTIQLDSEDFEIADRMRPLRIPRAGKARTKARFDIRPLHDGASKLEASIFKDGNFIQQMTLVFEIGTGSSAATDVSTKGRPPAAVNVVKPRDLTLLIAPATGGYECWLHGPTAARARMPLAQDELAKVVDLARQQMMKVVTHQDANGRLVFQAGLDIPEEDRQFALKTLADAGAMLFRKIFQPNGAAADLLSLGKKLRASLAEPSARLQLQIVAEHAPIPWAAMYVGDTADESKLDWSHFIGMRHVVEQIPFQYGDTVSAPIIDSAPKLQVSLNLNTTIDTQMKRPFVADQQAFWNGMQANGRRLGLTGRTTRAQFTQALNNSQTADQILYLYCHATAAGLDNPGGVDASSLTLSDAHVTLGELGVKAPIDVQLAGRPLVFINACESAELSAAFYDGFVPYFMAKGARGVVGTECKTPALFAQAWAGAFFGRFLDGESLGEAFLSLRREFLEKHGNPLGLLYAVHCDGDTQIQPAPV
ncbi:CHAT domain-containing protein [Variovorax sp. JS1663]|uniref:CHAT domain-containing protein n=1 Tax=Variovorax sp. JS1663 TaxID=1851577 RepID=UPI000B345143|nr:CHAT domain-containing protein [Variovorax sp. JS1663]OUL98590.1 hypothetical protein A8M77_30640 [Variovorax sp. JS1663]